MPELTITTKSGKGRASHDHVIYLDENSGMGWSSPDKGHTHSFRYEPGTPGDDGLLIPTGWLMNEDDTGHQHAVGQYQPKEKAGSQTPEEAVVEVVNLYRAGKETEKESREKAEESDRFYMGEHWTPRQRSDLEAKNRAALVINKSQKEVHDLSGHQRENRTDMKFLPIEGGDARVADILNVVVKTVLTNTDMEREESKVFLDQVITGRGNFNLYYDNEKDIKGQIKVEKFPWKNVYYGPHEKEDLSDCEYLVKWTWYSYAKIKQLFPEKASEIQATVDFLLSPDAEGAHEQVPGKQYTDAVNHLNAIKVDPDLTNVGSKEFRVLECWQRVYRRTSVIVDPATDFYFNAEDWTQADINRSKEIPGLTAVPRNVSKMRITKVAGGVLLEDENPADLDGIDDFMLTPAYAIKRGDAYQGIVELIKDPQRLINKLSSLAVDIANKMTAYGWFIDAETFVDKFEKDKFKKNSTSPGFISEVQNLNKVPQAVQGVKMPNELVNLLAMFDQTLNDLMSMTPEPLGNNDSGVAILQKVRTKIRGVEYLFDNLSLAKRRLGRQIITLIQKHFSPDMIMRIIANQSAKAPVMVAGKSLEEYDPADIQKLLETADLGLYDIAVSESGYSPTQRMANFMIWADMAKGGVQVPPDLLVELSDLPDKQAMLERIRQFQMMQAQAEQQKANTEIQKTIIAATAKQNQAPPGGSPGMGGAPPPGPPMPPPGMRQ